MPKVKVLARNWIIELNTGDDVTPAWTKIGGINTFTRSSDKEDADTTDFDSLGHAESMVASRSNEISFEGQYIEDTLDGTRDAGQQAVEDAAELIGPESLVPLRLTSPSGTVTEYTGTLVVGDVGGGNNDPTSWGATMTVSGKPTKVTP